jgi:hypothetical protein
MKEEYTGLPKTRREANRLGEAYYFNGTPCPKGHISKRRTHNWTCLECEKETRKKAIDRTSDSYFVRKKHSKTKDRLYHPNQIPSWANLSIIRQMFIDARQKGLVLDHIVPLRGRKRGGVQVCGLHCEANLQEMTPEDNNKKSFNDWPDAW